MVCVILWGCEGDGVGRTLQLVIEHHDAGASLYITPKVTPKGHAPLIGSLTGFTLFLINPF